MLTFLITFLDIQCTENSQIEIINQIINNIVIAFEIPESSGTNKG
jgi:hypothetical protein